MNTPELFTVDELAKAMSNPLEMARLISKAIGATMETNMTQAIDLKTCVKVKFIELPLTREYQADEIIEVAEIPAHARIIRLTQTTYMPADPETFMGAQMQVHLGTPAHPEIFSTDYTGTVQATDMTGMMGAITTNHTHKEEQATSLQMKILPNNDSSTETKLVAGQTIKLVVEYLDETPEEITE